MTFDFTQLTAQSRHLVDKTFYLNYRKMLYFFGISTKIYFFHVLPAYKVCFEMLRFVKDTYLGCQSVMSVCIVLCLDY